LALASSAFRCCGLPKITIRRLSFTSKNIFNVLCKLKQAANQSNIYPKVIRETFPFRQHYSLWRAPLLAPPSQASSHAAAAAAAAAAGDSE